MCDRGLSTLRARHCCFQGDCAVYGRIGTKIESVLLSDLSVAHTNFITYCAYRVSSFSSRCRPRRFTLIPKDANATSRPNGASFLLFVLHASRRRHSLDLCAAPLLMRHRRSSTLLLVDDASLLSERAPPFEMKLRPQRPTRNVPPVE